MQDLKRNRAITELADDARNSPDAGKGWPEFEQETPVGQKSPKDRPKLGSTRGFGVTLGYMVGTFSVTLELSKLAVENAPGSASSDCSET